MRNLLSLCLAICLTACATESDGRQLHAVPNATELVGAWKVDLRPTPDAAEYYQEFVITSVDGNTFQGSFYGSPISHGRINTDWSAVRIAFVTADGSGPYHHSAVLVGQKLEGLTNSTGREFLSYWSAEKP